MKFASLQAALMHDQDGSGEALSNIDMAAAVARAMADDTLG